MAKILFFAGLIVAASGLISPPIALALGIAFGFSFAHPFHAEARHGSRLLLQLSVIGLGFGMNLHQVLQAGRSGFVYTAISITFALCLGWALGKLLSVKATTSYLISTGTAICGGSAIAAIAPITGADEEEIAVSLGTIFILNSVALFLFPLIGTALHMSQTQFGLWAALAIHDTSSVVGAAAKFGALALAVGTTVKLARALWIVPLALGTAAVKKSKARIHWPWFILFFCLAAVANTYFHPLHSAYPWLKQLGIIGLTVTLFLIGTGLSIKTIRQVGPRPLLQGVLLWIVVACGSLALIRAGWIHL
ncbi:MAG: putative sulfate exporter family transporter [Terracidiphilus sp.]